MRNLLSVFLLFMLFTAAAQAAPSKKLTAILHKSGLSPQEHKSLESYSRELGKEIHANWFPVEYNGSFRTVVQLNIYRDDVPHYAVSETSGNAELDSSCLKAIERSVDSTDFSRQAQLEYLFEYKNKNSKATNIPVPWNRVLAYPFQMTAGYISKQIGLNTFVNIPIY